MNFKENLIEDMNGIAIEQFYIKYNTTTEYSDNDAVEDEEKKCLISFN